MSHIINIKNAWTRIDALKMLELTKFYDFTIDYFMLSLFSAIFGFDFFFCSTWWNFFVFLLAIIFCVSLFLYEYYTRTQLPKVTSRNLRGFKYKYIYRDLYNNIFFWHSIFIPFYWRDFNHILLFIGWIGNLLHIHFIFLFFLHFTVTVNAWNLYNSNIDVW